MITSTSNERVKWVRALQARRQAREREQSYVVEGARLAQEAVAAQYPVQLVFHTDQLDENRRSLVNNLQRLGAQTALVSDAVMTACSSTESPQGILAVVPFPTTSLPERLSLALVIDRLADPGNLGTMLRTALASGVEAVILVQGTVDAFNPKVVRSAMGAHFYLPIASFPVEQIRDRLQGLTFIAAQSGAGVPYHRVDWQEPVALMIGAEAHGLQPALSRIASQCVHIPMREKVESLNAAIAAAVILFEIARQRGER